MIKQAGGAVGLFVIVAMAFAFGYFIEGGTSGDGRGPSQFSLISAPKSFDGNPASPQPFGSSPEFADWDVQIHSRDVNTWTNLEPMQAQHGPACEGPPAAHENHTYEGAVFLCKEHIMTAINAGGYGLIVLTPNKMFNFCNGPAMIQWEMSTAIMSTRDWPDFWITPWEKNLTLPFGGVDADLQGKPVTYMQVNLENSEYAPVASIAKDSVQVIDQPGWQGAKLNSGVVAGTNQSAVRQVFKITVSRTSFRFERLASNTATALVYFNHSFLDVGFCEGVFQMAHHSYNPQKDGAGVPATWHWDNVDISTFTPFTIIKANQASTSGGVVTFPQPAPANAFLRFSGIGIVSVNGQVVQRQVFKSHPEHSSSYFVPIAQGTTSVTLSFAQDNWYIGPFRARDISIWSKDASALPTPTRTNTPLPTATRTSTATRTPTPVPQATATPTLSPPTATPVTPTSTPPPPTPTGTPIPVFCDELQSTDLGQTYHQQPECD